MTEQEIASTIKPPIDWNSAVHGAVTASTNSTATA